MTPVRDTSIEAYRYLQDTLGKRQLKVYEAIKRCYLNWGASTDREIATYLGWKDPNNVRPRRNELVEMGWVVEAGKRKCKVSGRTVWTWRPTQ